jgi:hypothetical protein
LLPPLLQPATTSAPSAAVAMITFRLMDMPLSWNASLPWRSGGYQARLAGLGCEPGAG